MGQQIKKKKHSESQLGWRVEGGWGVLGLGQVGQKPTF